MLHKCGLLLAMELLFEPGKWHACQKNDYKSCEDAANCYSYILNQPEYYWAVPGMGYAKIGAQRFIDSFNKYFEGTSLADFQKRLKAGAAQDGLVSVEEPAAREGYYLAALFFSNKADDLDFHWYRRDDDGIWSHKDGWHAPSKQDAEGNAISDPRNIAVSSYPIFGGFFLVPRKGVALGQGFPLS